MYFYVHARQELSLVTTTFVAMFSPITYGPMRKYSSKMLLNLIFVQEILNMSEINTYMHWSVHVDVLIATFIIMSAIAILP